MGPTAKQVRTESIEHLWARYSEMGDPGLRNRLVLSLAPLVKYIVYRKVREVPRHCEVQDFISCGLEAVMRSLDRYDPGKGASLEQFIWTRVQGAVLDELRRGDWAPRSLRRWERELARAQRTFLDQHGRVPSDAEIAAVLGISPDELHHRLADLDRATVESLNVVVPSEADTLIERVDAIASSDLAIDPEQRALTAEARERFRAAFAQLPEREQSIAVLMYVHGLKLREVGEILSVSESRVCQLHAQLRRRLAKLLAEEAELFDAVA